MPKIPFDIYIGVMWGLIMCFSIQNLVPKDKRLHRKKFIYYLLCTVFFLFLINSREEPLRFILVSGYLILSIFFFYRIGIMKSILFTVIDYFVEGIGSFIALLIFLNILNRNFGVIKENLFDRFIMYTIIAVVSFIEIKIINLPWNKIKIFYLQKSLNYKNILNFTKYKENILIAFFFLFAIAAVAFYFSWTDKILNIESKLSYAHIYSLFLFPIVVFNGYMMYKIANLRSIELSRQKKQYDELKLYTGVIEGLSNDIKRHNHDFNNIIMAQRGFIDQNNWEGLKNYFFNEVLKEQESLKKNENIYFHLQNLSHPALKGLCTSKLNKALNLDLNISLTILDKIENFPVEAIDLSRMTGILLDNAIEASSKSAEKTLSIAIMKEEVKTSMVIANSFCEKPDLDHIYKEGFSTKGEHRGLGLGILQELVHNKYKNIRLNTGIERDVFIQELEFLDI